MALPCLPAAAQSLVTTIASPAHSIRTAPVVDDGVFEGARALGHSLARAVSLHLEGKWTSRLPKLFEIVGGCSPRERLGAVLLLAHVLPPALPITFEQLSAAALPLQAPEQYLQPPALLSNAGFSAAAAGTRGPGASADPTHQDLVAALETRRKLWSGLLSQHASELPKLVVAFAVCSCQQVCQGLVALVARLVDLLAAGGYDAVLQPLLQLQHSLGRCAKDPALELPAGAPGDAMPALRRMTLLLVAVARHSSCRAGIVAADDALMSAVLVPTLRTSAQGGSEALQAGGLALLDSLCDTSAGGKTADAAADSTESAVLPSSSVLMSAIAAVLALCDGPDNSVAQQARQTAVNLQIVLSGCTEPALQQLASVLMDVAREAGRAVAQEAGADASSTSAAVDRGTLWPRAWRKQDGDASELLCGQASAFGSGRVKTVLEYGLQASTTDASGKRPRMDHEATGADAPPPVRGGRGRVRDDAPVQRGKANTTRPASKHVDDYQGAAPKRFQNSSRAPSKHVDDYQNAPVVRRVVLPTDQPRRGADDTGSPGGGAPPAQGDEMHARAAGRPFNGGCNNAGPGPGNAFPQQGHGNMPPQGHGNMPPQGHGNMHTMQQRGFQGGPGAHGVHDWPPLTSPCHSQTMIPQPLRWQAWGTCR